MLLTLTLERNSDKGWLPANMSLRNDPEGADKQVPLVLTSINTGAGDIALVPLLIGYVIQDREGVLCEDTCIGAFSGRCNDGSLNTLQGGTGTYCDLGLSLSEML